MINNQKVLAIIPARGGSKGLPQKNIKILAGKPLIAWSIEVPKNCKFIDDVVVSTDDLQIAEISKKYGANVPFIRPRELATDTARTSDVIKHTLEFYQKNGINYEWFVLLQPTSPLRRTEDLDKAFDLLVEKHATSIMSVCENEHHPFWSNELPADLNMNNFEKYEYKNLSRQQLPKYYRLNGAIYIVRTDLFLQTLDFYTEKTFAYVMPQKYSIDIDTKIDFQLAELLIDEKNGSIK